MKYHRERCLYLGMIGVQRSSRSCSSQIVKCVWIPSVRRGVVQSRVDVVAAHEEWRIRPAAHEVSVEQIFFDEDMDHRHRQFAIGAGLYSEPTVGFLSKSRLARIDDDELGAAVSARGLCGLLAPATSLAG